MNVIGIDLGGSFVKIGILKNTELSGEAEIQVDDNQSWNTLAAEIETQINKLVRKTGINQVDGIGLAFPGQVDSVNMRVLRTTKYLDAPSFDFPGWAERNWASPMVIENDARLACIGEWQFGSGDGSKNMLMVTLGTGIGSGVIMDNKIVYGRNFRAGNLIGHTILDYNAEPCQCGNKGCAESLASSWSLDQIIRKDPDYRGSKYAKSGNVDFKSVLKSGPPPSPTWCTILILNWLYWAVV
jgi:glucokinase